MDSALRDSAPRCQDDAILAPPGEHAVVSQLQSMVYDVSTKDPWTFGAVAVTLAAVALAANTARPANNIADLRLEDRRRDSLGRRDSGQSALNLTCFT